jgi:carboxyl-terminal processing protease
MRRRPSRAPWIAAAGVGLLIALVIGVWLGGHPSWIPSGLRGTFVDQGGTQLVQEVLDDLQNNYYRPVNRSALLNDVVNNGLESAVASLKDPYSHYYSRPNYQSFQNETNPHLSGIGVDVNPRTTSKGLPIEAVFPGSPAARAGLRGGDVIVAVGSTSLAGRTSDFASSRIRGRAGTKVTLIIERGTRRLTFTIARANIVVPVASSSIVSYRGQKLGYLQFTSFTQGSGDELRAQVQKVLHQGAQGVILDLRGNGGGLLNEAINVASIFIPDGTIVSTHGRNQPSQVYVAKGNAIAPHIPMVVLVDRDTASSAEIVTAALQDRRRAVVIGTHTYGKGVFQEIQPLPNGGALDMTVGEFFTPSGRNLGGPGVAAGKTVAEGAGITPNVYAVDNPSTPRIDEALVTAERTVAAEINK